MKKQFKDIVTVTIVFAFLFAPHFLKAQSVSFGLKSAPADLTFSINGEAQRPLSQAAGVRNFRFDSNGRFEFSAPGYNSLVYTRENLPLENGRLEIKLENENGKLQKLGEYETGIQPKSAYFSPDGKKIFVPLLGQRGIDVFTVAEPAGRPAYIAFDRRLDVAGGITSGSVEALSDSKRRELWVSNMNENKVHIFDLDTLNHKISVATGGVFPKVIAQNPAGDLTVVSNWVSCTISVFNSDTKELIRRIPVGGTPRGMAFSPDGKLLYVANYDEAVVEVIDMEKNSVGRKFRLYEGVGACRSVIYRDGKLYVSDMYRGTVNILNASTGALLVSRRVGPNINTIVLSPDGRHVFASSRGRNNPEDYTRPGPDFGAVYMLNAEDLSLEERVWGRNQPTGLAVSPDGKYLVFTDFLDKNIEFYSIR